MQKVLLNNDEYNILFQKGGDSLVAFFATIRHHKKEVVYRKKGRKGAYSTIRHYTGLSLNTIRTYFPILLELRMVSIHNNGNIAVKGRKDSKKLIPIQVHDKFTDTKSSSYFVRIHSNLKSQERGIKKKAERIELYCKYKEDKIDLKELKALQRLERRGLNETTLKDSYRSNSTLSNSKFSTIKGSNSKSSGKYQKSKLVSMGLLSQQRDFILFKAGIFTKHDVNYLRNEFCINGIFLTDYGIVKEISPIISICNSRY